MRRELVFGPHIGRQVGDVIEMTVHGEVTREHAVLLHDCMAQVLAEEGRCFVLADLADATTVQADARRYMAEWHRGHRTHGIASYNVGPATRVIATLLLKTIQLLGEHPTEMVFVREEAEARAWIAANRARTASLIAGPA